MKNKRILAVMVLLVLVLLLGIGYAVTEKSLIISGNASALAEDNNFTVRFKKTGDSYDAPANLVNAEASVTADDRASIKVAGLKKKGDTASATYTIENVSDDIDASVIAEVASTNNEFFKVTTTGITDTATTVKSGDSTKTVTVNVELLKTPITEQTADITVTLKANAVQQ